MKKILFTLLLLAGAACTPQESSAVRFTYAHPLDSECVPVQSHYISAGLLNVAMMLTPSYPLGFGIESYLGGNFTDVEGEILAGSERNDFYVNLLHRRYVSVPPLPLPSEPASALHTIIRPGDTDGTFALDMISAAIAPALQALAAGDSVTLTATIQLEGRLASGQGMRTNEVNFPIRVVRTPPPATCADGAPPTLVEGPCGNVGQDSLGWTCTR